MTLTALAGCSTPNSTTNSYPTALMQILDGAGSPADDVFEVFVCEVPAETHDPTFKGLDLRLSLVPDTIAALMNANVSSYFDTLSHGKYRPHFVAGATLMMSATETPDQCVERAVDESGSTTSAVMTVANAEHIASAGGGWGRPGQRCDRAFCPASTTRRALYVGASDFHPDWGPIPLLDLIEHEIGHTLDLPHSGDGRQSDDQHSSALDVMSNSAAGRDPNARPVRVHGQDTIGINRLALGWLTTEDIAVAEPSEGRFELSSSTGATGLRLLILTIDADAFLTVEYLAATGFNDFLPTPGIAVHRIDQSRSVCDRPATDEGPCTGVNRAQITLGSPAPHLDLLDEPGESWVLDGWRITVRNRAGDSLDSLDEIVEVEVTATER